METWVYFAIGLPIAGAVALVIAVVRFLGNPDNYR